MILAYIIKVDAVLYDYQIIRKDLIIYEADSKLYN